MNDKMVGPNPLEKRWVKQKQQELLALFPNPLYFELRQISKYLSLKVNYVTFMRYLKSIHDGDRESSLLEVAEQTSEKVKRIIHELQEIWVAMPEELKTIEFDQKLLRQFDVQLTEVREIASGLSNKLEKFINGQYLTAAVLYPIFNELSRIFDLFLVKTQSLLTTVLLNIKELNPDIESEETYQVLVAGVTIEIQEFEVDSEIKMLPVSLDELLAQPTVKPSNLLVANSSNGLTVDNILAHKPVLQRVLGFISISELFLFGRVNKNWHVVANSVVNIVLEKNGVSEIQVERFHKLPSYLQYVILKRVIELDNPEKLQQLFIMLDASLEERRGRLTPPQVQVPIMAEKLNDVGIVLHCLDMLKVDDDVCTGLHYSDSVSLHSQYGALMLVDGFITHAQTKRFTHSGSPSGSHANLSQLVCKNGYFAVREGLLKPEDAPGISDLRSLLSDNGLKAMRHGWITPAQAKGIYHSGQGDGPHDNLAKLLSGHGFIALEKGYITPEQAAYFIPYPSGFPVLERGLISYKNFPGSEIKKVTDLSLTHLSSPLGLVMLEEKLVTQEHLVRHKHLIALICDNGLKLLRSGQLTVEQAARIVDLSTLLSNSGIKALESEIVTIEDAMCNKSLGIIKTPQGVRLLEEGLMTLAQSQPFYCSSDYVYANTLEVLLGPVGYEALKRKLITPEDAATFHYPSGGRKNNLRYLLTPLGLQALERKLVESSQASQAELWLMFSEKNDPAILTALELQLASLSDFMLYGKFCNTGFTPEKVNAEILRLLSADKKGTASPKISAPMSPKTSFFSASSEDKKTVQYKSDCNKVGDVSERPAISTDRVALHKEMSTKIIPFLIKFPSLLRPFVEQLQLKDYEKALWELCHIQHEVVGQILVIMSEYRIQLGINFDKKMGESQQSVLHVAAQFGSIDIYNLLKIFGGDEDLQDAIGVTPKNYLEQRKSLGCSK